MLNKKNVKGALLALVLANPFIASGAGFDNIYVIGDSLSDQGNLFHATESSGFGIPATDHYWEGRFANGEIWSGILASRMGITLEPSLFLNGTLDYRCIDEGSDCGTNFADGGARTDYNRVEDDNSKPLPVPYLVHEGFFPEDAFPWTLEAQVAAFASRGATGPDALYVVFAGANDLSDLISMVATCYSGHAVFCGGRGDPAVTIPLVLGGINNAIATFVAAGARDILVPNIPNLGVIPAITPFGQDFVALATGLSAQYNLALDGVLAGWEAAGVNIIRFDSFSLLTEVVETPETFGFSNAEESCYDGFVVANPSATECDTPDSYVFWDVEHPTAAFHAFMAERVMGAIVVDILDDLELMVMELVEEPELAAALSRKLDKARKNIAHQNGHKHHRKHHHMHDRHQHKHGKHHRKYGKHHRKHHKPLQGFVRMVKKRVSGDAAHTLIQRAKTIKSLLKSEHGHSDFR